MPLTLLTIIYEMQCLYEYVCNALYVKASSKVLWNIIFARSLSKAVSRSIMFSAGLLMRCIIERCTEVSRWRPESCRAACPGWRGVFVCLWPRAWPHIFAFDPVGNWPSSSGEHGLTVRVMVCECVSVSVHTANCSHTVGSTLLFLIVIDKQPHMKLLYIVSSELLRCFLFDGAAHLSDIIIHASASKYYVWPCLSDIIKNQSMSNLQFNLNIITSDYKNILN